ncbi:hypothetical protein GCM10019059_06150 [Camelimonas fluminis]|uniref:Uncharacterized protein n=1 Tax=Camelimonas fluminis TaxID=1576911 RepID=A0ABV7UGJ7_9HYPH|nr:hypothetical protein [Camelimonas fluminis]GHE49754.1 hypothetical protein GCM10019059_06150 [Camelimonas fluminis]
MTVTTGMLTRRAFGRLLAGGLAIGGAWPFPTPAFAREPQTTESWARYEALVAALLETGSATETLAAWSRRRGWDDRIVAHKLEADMRPAPAQIAALLDIREGETVGYRKVALASGERVLSRADNWFTPGRLSSGVNAGLDASQTPFGRLVSRLSPTRRVVNADRLWANPQQGAPAEVFRLFAVVSGETDAGRKPLAVVNETYQAVMVL